MIRAAFLDLGGTLLGPEVEVSPRVRRAVAATQASGCEVVLCTGRSRVSVEPIADQLGLCHRQQAEDGVAQALERFVLGQPAG